MTSLSVLGLASKGLQRVAKADLQAAVIDAGGSYDMDDTKQVLFGQLKGLCGEA